MGACNMILNIIRINYMILNIKRINYTRRIILWIILNYIIAAGLLVNSRRNNIMDNIKLYNCSWSAC